MKMYYMTSDRRTGEPKLVSSRPANPTCTVSEYELLEMERELSRFEVWWAAQQRERAEVAV